MGDEVTMVSVISVSYNSAHVLANAIEPFCGEPDFQVIVVDNASRDESVSVAASMGQDVQVVSMPTNLGFGKAVNAGAEMAVGDFILLLNPDAEFSDTACRDLVQIVRDGGDQVGCAAPFVEPPSGGRIIGAGNEPTWIHVLNHSLGIARLASVSSAFRGLYLFADDVRSRQVQEVAWASAGCLLVRSEVFRLVGGMPEDWFMYGEDIEFCLRVRDAGWRVIVSPRQVATHSLGGSSKGVDGRTNPAWIVNLYELACRRYQLSVWQRLLWRTSAQVGFFIRFLWYRVQAFIRPRQSVEMNRQAARYLVFYRALS